MAESTGTLGPQTWTVMMNRDDELEMDIVPKISAETAYSLYSFSAIDKAASVPYIRIWQLGPDGGLVYPPLSDQFRSTPKFGENAAFSERPIASIDSVQVKTVNPGGWILYRELDISLVVHKPSALNTATGPGAVVRAMQQPDKFFMLEYGWAGGLKAGVLGPGASRREDRTVYTPHEKREEEQWQAQKKKIDAENKSLPPERRKSAPPEPKFFETVFTATSFVRFKITNYNFSIQPDNQIKFTIKAFEDSEFNLRSANIFDQSDLPEPTAPIGMTEDDALQKELERFTLYFSERIKQLSFLQPNNQSVSVIKLRDVFDLLFATPMVRAVNRLGYKHVHLYTGLFNQKAPTTVPALGEKSWAGQPIGEFVVKSESVRKILGDVLKTKGQITVYNLFKQVLALITDPAIWKLQNKQLDVSAPELVLFTLYNPKAGFARLQVMDRKRYITVLGGVSGMYDGNVHQKKGDIKSDLKGFLKKNPHIPYLTLFHHGSFFKDAKFEVVNDEQMKSIFINRTVQKSREEVTNKNPAAVNAQGTLPMGLMVYRSAIKGTMTMIGNFGFSIMGLSWINFGIPELDGIFYTLSKVDKIDREGFFTTLTVQAEGSNPLGVQPTPANVAEDWIREKLAKNAPWLKAAAQGVIPDNPVTQTREASLPTVSDSAAGIFKK